MGTTTTTYGFYVPSIGEPNSTCDPLVGTNFTMIDTAIYNVLNDLVMSHDGPVVHSDDYNNTRDFVTL